MSEPTITVQVWAAPMVVWRDYISLYSRWQALELVSMLNEAEDQLHTVNPRKFRIKEAS